MKVYVIFVFNMMAVLKTKGKLVQRMAQKFYKKNNRSLIKYDSISSIYKYKSHIIVLPLLMSPPSHILHTFCSFVQGR